LSYWSVIASLTPRTANVAANDRCSQLIILGELTTCLLTPFAEIKRGRKVKKNIDSLGLRILIKKPLVAICLKPFLWEGESPPSYIIEPIKNV